MRFLKYLFIFVLILIVAGSVYLASLDGSYDVKRSRLIRAAPEVVFNDLNDYRNWADWGPWYEEDSTIAVTYAEKTVGEGASYSWTAEGGDGSMRTLSTQPYERIDSEIVFKTPFGDMSTDVYWILEEQDTGTDLTWGMKGEMPFLTRFMASDMEEQMGPMEERGLELFDENLQKKLKAHSIEDQGVIDYSGGFYLYVSASSQITEMNPKFSEMMNEVETYASTQGIRLAGSPFALYHRFDIENNTTMFSVCYPVPQRIIPEPGSEVLTGYMKRGWYYKTVLKGSYEYSKKAWDLAMAKAGQIDGYVLDEKGEPFEIYVNHPSNTPNPANLVTEIYIPVIPKADESIIKAPDA